jgi:predicted Zn-dependent protease
MDWNLDHLKSELKSHKKLLNWIIIQENIHRRERYFLIDGKKVGLDQDREVNSQNLEVKLMVDIGKPGRQGEITKKLFKGEALKPQIENAISAAQETDHQAWSLPKDLPTQVPEVKSCDPKMLEDLNGTMDQVTGEIMETALSFPATQFNSSELFMSVHMRELHLSNGLTHRSQQSRMYVEAAYSFAKDGKSDEYLHTAWSVSPSDVSVTEIFNEASSRAHHSLDVQKPVTGKYSVIVDADVLGTLMTGYVDHLKSKSEYLQLPFKKIGEEFVEGATGDLINLTLDPTLEYGAVTAGLSELGTVEKPIQLVQNNKVIAHSIDLQHGEYLGKKPTTHKGNVVLTPGKMSHDQLTEAAPQVLEILQFSGLFFSPHSGTFSSEIRLARLFDHKSGKTTYIKGGSLSGSIAENFKNAKFSKETAKKAQFDYQKSDGYFGPKYALLSEVSVVG